MAAIDKVFSAIPFCGTEYHKSSNSFLQRTNPSGIVESPFLNLSVNEFDQRNSISVASDPNSSHSYFTMCSQYNQNHGSSGEGMGFLGNSVPIQHSEGSHLLPQAKTTDCLRQKHKRLQDDNDCPLKRRKVCVSRTPAVFEGCHSKRIHVRDSSQPYWSTGPPQMAETTAVPPLHDQSSEIMHTVLIEDMEENAVESHTDVALRRIRDIESRLIEEEDDDEEEESSSDSRLPTLIMSDVLVEGLKKGLDESLTKKIVDSINRPSMELVLWKPQPEFLVEKLQSIVSGCKDDSEASKQALKRSETCFVQEIGPLGVDEPCISSVDCDIDAVWGREEEEMEL